MTDPCSLTQTSQAPDLKSQTRTSPAKHPDATTSLRLGWKARHHGVRG